MRLNKIAFIDTNSNMPIKPEHKKLLAEAAPESELVFYKDVDELVSSCKNADAIFMWPSITPGFVQWCANAADLKWIHMFTSGVDAIMASDIGKMDLRISSTKGIHGAPMSDQTLAYIFAFLRQFPRGIRAQAARKWDLELMSLCDESFNKTVGLVGLGAIGQEIARKCKLLGMRVIAAKRHPIDCEWVDECMNISRLDDLLEQSDFVILILPLTDESRHIIGAEQLKKMKKSAYLINIARGGVLDHDALVEALRANEIAGAALDIFEVEPLPPENPLWDFDNVIISHHTSPHSPYYMDRAVTVISENIRRLINDDPILYEVDKTAGV